MKTETDVAKRRERGRMHHELKKRLGLKCVYCGCTNPLVLTIDHKTPLCKGGDDSEKNKQVCCWTCNQLKGALTHAEFRKYQICLSKMFDLQKVKLFYKENKVQVKFFPEFTPGE